MIYGPFSSFNRATEILLAAGTVLSADGQALVATTTNGVRTVKPATGSGAEVFAGISFVQTSAAPFLPTTAVKAETFVVPAGNVVTLAKTPVAGTLVAVNNADNSTVVIASTTGSAVTLTSAVGLTVTVYYRTALSVLDAQAIAGNVQPGGFSGNIFGSVSVVQTGVVFTDQFDSAVNWFTATGLKLAANGQITNQAGAGSSIPGTIVQAPSADYPYLGISFNAAA